MQETAQRKQYMPNLKIRAEDIKAQHNQAELAKAQHWAQLDQHKAESARLILAGQIGSEKGKAEQAKAELTEHKRVNQVKPKHMKTEEQIEEKSRQNLPECARDEQTNERKTVETSSAKVQDDNMKRKNGKTEDNLASKQSDGPTEKQSNTNEKTEASQAIHIRKHQTVKQPSLSARERQSSRNTHPTYEDTDKEKPQVKPKPKERVSTIPEISALADYARLKVIVSEDEANPIQEFPPNKKEGFFPIIQTRHSRRPVFTADPQVLPVKQKSVPKRRRERTPKDGDVQVGRQRKTRQNANGCQSQ
ncbi:hypothetical protein F7725_024087 [Dissostichus mawsoni]|uniref:Uncharacterized protein n=1 Tax=Dissostichus mawsoni TaxID=36200 RepID=A0A7J5XYC8_DISMA|nr:hypothetical protein F7725_024087 [Dissostichus mawsoni]